MKTSIFDATFTLPPMVEMIEVGKDMVYDKLTLPPPNPANSLRPCC